MNADTGAALAGIGAWRRQSTAATISVPHFESASDPATSTVQPNKLKGLGDNKVLLEGIVNLNTTDQTETGTTGLTNGAYVTVNLWISKTVQKGYQGVVGWISDFQLGTKINNEAASFTATLDVDGVFPAYGAVT